MSMVELVPEKVGPWTVDDLELLSGAWRYEIVDGALVMSPAPDRQHERVLALLRRSLEAQLPEHLITFGSMGIGLDLTYRVPDLLVVDLAGPNTSQLVASEVHLAVEVVSPSSRTTDRVTKPAEYASHGLRAYWRVETEPTVSITAYALRAGDVVYTELGTWGEGETLVVSEPFDLEVVVDDLTRGRTT